MKLISIPAKTYADSLIKSGLEREVVVSNLNLLIDTIKSSSDLEQLMLNPTVSSNVKFDILNDIFKDNLDEKIKNFIKVLLEKDRFSELGSILEAYLNKLDEIDNVQKTQIISAVPLNDSQKEQIIDKLNKKLSKSIIPEWLIDKDIIAGLVIKFGNQVIDSSLNTKLNMLSKR